MKTEENLYVYRCRLCGEILYSKTKGMERSTCCDISKPYYLGKVKVVPKEEDKE
jgi:hypothetical protein